MVKKLLGLVSGGARLDCWVADLGLALLRVFAGLSMAFGHGLGKLPPSGKFLEGVGAMGFPAPTVFAWAAALSEFGGALLVALGLFTRLGAAGVAFTMGVAAFVAHAQDPFGRKEMALLYLAIMVCFLLVGSGRFGLDALIRPRAKA